MLQTLQIAQLVLFLLTPLSLLVIGLLILFKPVSVIPRIWHMAVFLPLIIANLFAVFENQLVLQNKITLDVNVWLLLIIDLVLTGAIVFSFRGWMVYGLNAERVQELLLSYFKEKGLVWTAERRERKNTYGRASDAIRISVQFVGKHGEIWIIDRFNEVLVQVDSRVGACLLKSLWSSFVKIEVSRSFKQRATGIIYIVLAVIFAVMSWIFFFEPRLTLLE